MAKSSKFGMNLTCYSATKFLNGHSDVIAGAVMGSKDVISQVKYLRTFLETYRLHLTLHGY